VPPLIFIKIYYIIIIENTERIKYHANKH
jgi:hypothetical protein